VEQNIILDSTIVVRQVYLMIDKIEKFRLEFMANEFPIELAILPERPTQEQIEKDWRKERYIWNDKVTGDWMRQYFELQS